MKKKRFPILIAVICLALIIAVMPFVGACAEEKAAPTPAEPLILKYHSPFPSCGLTLAEEWWMDEVEKQTGGRIKFDRIFGGPLGTLDEQPMALKVGSFDMGQVSCVYNPGIYSASTVVILPFITDDVLAMAYAAHELFNQSTIEAEFTALNAKFMFNSMWAPIEMVAKDPITTIAGIGEHKVRAHGGSADALAALGITTYPVPMDELPAAAERGVVDAAIMGVISDVRDFGFQDVFPYWIIDMRYYYFPMTFCINLDTWNKLPDDIQKIMTDLNEMMPEQEVKLYGALQDEAWEEVKAAGMQKVQFDQAEKAKLVEEGGPSVWDKWIADREAEDLPGQKIFDELNRLIAKYGG